MKKIFEFDLDGDVYESALPREEYVTHLQFEIQYSLEQVVDADTPFGPKYGTDVVIEEIVYCDLYTIDRDGGEAGCYDQDIHDYYTEEELKELILKEGV